jgi:DNA polymerase I
MVAATVISVKVKSSISTTPQQLVAVEKPTPPLPLTLTTPQQHLVPLPRLQSPPASLVKNVPELGNFAAIDCEWSDSGIECFCLVSPCSGESMTLPLERCRNELEFATKILDVIEKYTIIAGHTLRSDNLDCDIEHIQKLCRKVGSRLERSLFKTPCLSDSFKSIDIWKIFSNKAMKGAFSQSGIDYATDSLQDISMAYIGEGKLNGLTGKSTKNLDVETRLEYCLKDCELVVKILQKEDYRILKIVHSISKIIKQNFLVTCQSGPSGWWRSLLRHEGYIEPDVEEIEIGGGKVLDPISGVHRNVVVLDCTSLYPTIASTRNLSSETINPSCCAEALPDEIMNMINKDLKEPRSPYRICKKNLGKFATIQTNLIKLKRRYKEQGLDIEAAAVKLVANSGYGVFGRPDFDFYDPRLAEVITAYGRNIISSFKEECPKFNLVPLYGDTDSIFLKGDDQDIERFTEWAEGKFDVTLDGKKWDILVLTPNKKSYFGILSGKVVHKKMWGLRGNNTPFEKELVESIITKEIIELVCSDKEEAEKAVFHIIKLAFARLEECNSEVKSKMAFSFVASEPLNEYGKGFQREIYLETSKVK